MVIPESKQRILTAAKELFLARGYGGTTVDAICEKARLTKGSFYHLSCRPATRCFNDAGHQL
jgi:TetR/AcrR family transcriptional regulator, transcriptional repressor for nem operon